MKNLKLKNKQTPTKKLSLDALMNVQRHFHININLLTQGRKGEDPLVNKLGRGVFSRRGLCFLQSASFFLAESKMLGEGETGKTIKSCPQLQNLERVDVNTVKPAFRDKKEEGRRGL